MLKLWEKRGQEKGRLEGEGWKEEKLEKKREKRENWRTKVEMRGQEKREGWEAQRAEGLLRLKWRRDGTTSCNLEGALCCVVLQDRTFDSQHETSLRHLILPGRSYEAGPPTLTAHSSHHCPQLLENTAKNNKKTTIWYPLIFKNPTKTWQKRQIHDKNQQKYHKNKAKTTIWCPKLTNRGSYVSEIFEQARISMFI